MTAMPCILILLLRAYPYHDAMTRCIHVLCCELVARRTHIPRTPYVGGMHFLSYHRLTYDVY